MWRGENFFWKMRNWPNRIYIGCVILMVCFFPLLTLGQTTDIVILNARETGKLQGLLDENSKIRALYDSIKMLADKGLTYNPNPQTHLSYEGMLPTHPDRIATEKSLEDMDKVVNLIYASYGSDSDIYKEKAKELVLSWSNTYIPNGNPINENKLTALFWGYHLFRSKFSDEEKTQVETWMKAIADRELARAKTPNNNWEAKRLKIIATISSILKMDTLNTYAVAGFKQYIASAYYEDGTSNDLRQRDALHYHVSGLKPTLAVFVNGMPFDERYNLFNYVSQSGSSVARSVDFVFPYATGELQREEWTNSKAAIDKKRAEAGLAAYQPGILYDPSHAIPLFEWVGFFLDDAYTLFGEIPDAYTASWVGLLNSPLIRNK